MINDLVRSLYSRQTFNDLVIKLDDTCTHQTATVHQISKCLRSYKTEINVMNYLISRSLFQYVCEQAIGPLSSIRVQYLP